MSTIVMTTRENLSTEVYQLHASLCSALADPMRILMLYTLNENPTTVNDLAARLGMSQPTTSRHLKILREQALVYATRQGANVEYSLADQRLIEALDLLLDVLRDRVQRRARLLETSDEQAA
jgi:DNA-binding transcriptional ArsR family regulator